MLSINSLMSSTFQAVMPSDNFTGEGYLPDRTPDHQDDLDTGIMGGIFEALSPSIAFSRRNPISGKFIIKISIRNVCVL